MANRRKRSSLRSYLLTYDMNLIVAVIFLIVFGLIMIYSASYYTAGMSSVFNNDPTYLLKNQLKYSIAGLAVMIFVANVPYRLWKKLAWPAILLAAFLILLLLSPLGVTVKGATRWIRLPGLGQFQVAEPVKVAMIVFTSSLIAKYGSKMKTMKDFALLMLPGLMLFVMIWKISNNMSTALIILGINFIMAFVVHPKYAPFVALAAVGVIGVVGIIYYTVNFADAESGFRLTRIQAWLDPYSYESDTAYQSLQGLYAIGSGGLMGKGLGNSIQKLGKIPEPYNDMIFSIICEELGIFGAGLVILLFIYFLYRIYSIAQSAEDLFGRLLSIGVFAHVALQVVLNLMVVTGMFPTTGVTLPFFSYGGTATVFLLVEIGMVLNVEKVSRLKREREMREERIS